MYEDIRSLAKDIKSNWKFVAERFQYAKSKFFYSEEFISLLLFKRSYKKLPKTEFINYNLAFSYYPQSKKQLTIARKSKPKSITIPYCELVNFIKEPNAKIAVQAGMGQYNLPAEITNLTNTVFEKFLADRPNTTNGKVLRLADFSQVGAGTYSAKLQTANYFDSVRSNLTLDHYLDGDFFTTLRLKELGKDNALPELNRSALANHIGVSTVLGFQSKGSWYFHMLPRAEKLGVFTGMLASVGGVAIPPKETPVDLAEYLASELKRELQEETGLNVAQLEQQNSLVTVPLVLLRELSRGGKPQMMFLTVLGEMDDKEFEKAFSNAEWKSEFKSDAFSNVKSLNDVVSPEFSTNLLYALQYIKMRQKLPTDPLVLE